MDIKFYSVMRRSNTLHPQSKSRSILCRESLARSRGSQGLAGRGDESEKRGEETDRSSEVPKTEMSAGKEAGNAPLTSTPEAAPEPLFQAMKKEDLDEAYANIDYARSHPRGNLLSGTLGDQELKTRNVTFQDLVKTEKQEEHSLRRAVHPSSHVGVMKTEPEDQSAIPITKKNKKRGALNLFNVF